MKKIKFDTNFEPPFGKAVELSPLIRRVTCNNPGPFTFRGTNTFIVGRGSVAIIDPGPDDEAHLAAIVERGEGRDRQSYFNYPHAYGSFAFGGEA